MGARVTERTFRPVQGTIADDDRQTRVTGRSPLPPCVRSTTLAGVRPRAGSSKLTVAGPMKLLGGARVGTGGVMSVTKRAVAVRSWFMAIVHVGTVPAAAQSPPHPVKY